MQAGLHPIQCWCVCLCSNVLHWDYHTKQRRRSSRNMIGMLLLPQSLTCWIQCEAVDFNVSLLSGKLLRYSVTVYLRMFSRKSLLHKTGKTRVLFGNVYSLTFLALPNLKCCRVTFCFCSLTLMKRTLSTSSTTWTLPSTTTSLSMNNLEHDWLLPRLSPKGNEWCFTYQVWMQMNVCILTWKGNVPWCLYQKWKHQE